jgi:hypothetical protein
LVAIEAHLQALEQSRQENALVMVETLRGVEARIWALEQSQRETNNRLQPLEAQKLRVIVGWVAVTAFLAGLAVGLAVWLFQ